MKDPRTPKVLNGEEMTGGKGQVEGSGGGYCDRGPERRRSEIIDHRGFGTGRVTEVHGTEENRYLATDRHDAQVRVSGVYLYRCEVVFLFSSEYRPNSRTNKSHANGTDVRFISFDFPFENHWTLFRSFRPLRRDKIRPCEQRTELSEEQHV